ncbi:hypothetical protein GOODEAATRI_007452, partial [Goodea atripinnis]
HLPLAWGLSSQMYICQQKASRAVQALLQHIGPFYWIIICSGMLHIAPEPALGIWETFYRDKLTLSSEERVSLNLNLPSPPYLVISSASLFLLTDYSNPQEMCSATHLTRSLRLTFWHFVVHIG